MVQAYLLALLLLAGCYNSSQISPEEGGIKGFIARQDKKLQDSIERPIDPPSYLFPNIQEDWRVAYHQFDSNKGQLLLVPMWEDQEHWEKRIQLNFKPLSRSTNSRSLFESEQQRLEAACGKPIATHILQETKDDLTFMRRFPRCKQSKEFIGLQFGRIHLEEEQAFAFTYDLKQQSLSFRQEQSILKLLDRAKITTLSP